MKRFSRVIDFPEPGEYKLTIFPNGDHEYEHIIKSSGTPVIVRDRSFEINDAYRTKESRDNLKLRATES